VIEMKINDMRWNHYLALLCFLAAAYSFAGMAGLGCFLIGMGLGMQVD
jgi:hypothetical protein